MEALRPLRATKGVKFGATDFVRRIQVDKMKFQANLKGECLDLIDRLSDRRSVDPNRNLRVHEAAFGAAEILRAERR